ncbi:MAG: glycosyltransferase [bacterium]
MKIAVIHSIYKPFFRGGAETVVATVVERLRLLKHDVSVITLGKKEDVELLEGVRVYRLSAENIFNYLDINKKPFWRRIFWHIRDMFNFKQANKVMNIIKQNKPDLILTHNLKGLSYILPGKLARLDVPWIHTIHDAQLIYPSGLVESRDGLVAKAYRIVCRFLFSAVKKVIFPSHYFTDLYDRHGYFDFADKKVLGNPVDVVVKEIKFDGRIDNLVYIGQIEEYKGILELITEFKKIVGDFTLHVVGEGSASEKAKILADDDRRIIFYGQLTHQELEDKIWPQIDLLVNPSKTPESFGMVIIEAFAHGIPVLAANIGALPELIKDKQMGWLFNWSKGNFGEKLNRILTSREEINFSEDRLNEAKKFQVENYLKAVLEFAKLNK